MKALNSMDKKEKRLLALTAAYVLVDLVRGKKPSKTVAKVAAAHTKSGVRSLKKKGVKKAGEILLVSAVAGAVAGKDPKSKKNKKMKKKIRRFLLEKIA